MSVKLDSSLVRFVEEAKRYPMLSPERENEIALAWRDRGDRVALDALVGSHLRLVVKIARGFSGYGLPLADLVSEGNVGLIQAAQKFDPERGFRFATYAMWWIRASMQEYILHSWSLVKIGTTAAQKKLFFNLRRLKTKFRDLEQGDLASETVTAISRDLNVPEREVIDMNRRLMGADSSLNAVIDADSESEWVDLLVDDGPSQEAVIGDDEECSHRRALLGAALKKLDSREREVVIARWLSETPTTLEELSGRYIVSRERVRQIEVRAISKMSTAVANLSKERLRARS